jgi:SNF2 family DNA or RNA helicase
VYTLPHNDLIDVEFVIVFAAANPANRVGGGILLFCPFVTGLVALLAALGEFHIPYLEYHGDISQSKRHNIIETFNKSENMTVLLINGGL